MIKSKHKTIKEGGVFFMEGSAYSPKLQYNGYDFMYRVFDHCRYPFRVTRSIKGETLPTALHLHDFPQIWYTLSGNYNHYIEDTVYRCPPGTLIIVPPGTGHCFDIAPEDSAELICLQGTHYFFNKLPEPYRTALITNLFLPRFSSELRFSLPLCLHLCNDERRRFENALIYLATFDYTVQLPNIISLRRITGELFSEGHFFHSDAQREKAGRIISSKLLPIMDVLLYINKNLARKITSEELLKLSMMSYSEFFKYFKKITGVTLTEYIGRLRVRRALSYVAYTQYSFDYIADLCGFGDRTYLGKLFKRYHGITMTEERSRQETTKKEYPFTVITHNFINRVNLEPDFE